MQKFYFSGLLSIVLATAVFLLFKAYQNLRSQQIKLQELHFEKQLITKLISYISSNRLSLNLLKEVSLIIKKHLGLHDIMLIKGNVMIFDSSNHNNNLLTYLKNNKHIFETGLQDSNVVIHKYEKDKKIYNLYITSFITDIGNNSSFVIFIKNDAKVSKMHFNKARIFHTLSHVLSMAYKITQSNQAK